jgi:hypothetical protein
MSSLLLVSFVASFIYARFGGGGNILLLFVVASCVLWHVIIKTTKSLSRGMFVD